MDCRNIRVRNRLPKREESRKVWATWN